MRGRSDSAAYDQPGVAPWAGRGGRCAVSAAMSRPLQPVIAAWPPDAWPVGAQQAQGGVREWAEGAVVPRRATEKRGPPPAR